MRKEKKDDKNSKNLVLMGVIALVIVSIFFIQGLKNKSNAIIEKKELAVTDDVERIKEKESRYPKAVELVRPDGYLNTDKITIGENIGKKIVLVDFWTYSCINCQRTLPYLNAWHEKYKDKGLVIIGVHTPEFEFEKDYLNVQKAIEKYLVKYPVVQDNDYLTWRAYSNRYWPRKYLIDIDGFIVYDHIGEGAYAETEQEIQELLEERSRVLGMNEDIDNMISYPDSANPDFRRIGTPEIYFGYGFSRNQMGNPEGWKPEEIVSYEVPGEIEKNLFYLSGSWHNENDGMKLASDYGSITIRYFAKQVNLVAGSENPVEIAIYLDGKELQTLTASGHDLYTVVSDEDYGEHELEIRAMKGLEAFTFTFG